MTENKGGMPGMPMMGRMRKMMGNTDDMKAVHNIMIDMSYERYHHTENDGKHG